MNRSIEVAKTCFFLALLTLGFARTATAGSLYFTGANTTWDNGATADWATSSAGPYTSPWQDGSDAHFQGAAGNVTVSGSIASVNSLNFDTSGYTLTAGAINLTGINGAINVVSGGAATINSVLTGSTGVTETGSGLLTLGGANTFTGGTTVSAGTLAFGAVPSGGAGNISGSLAINPGAAVDAGNNWNLGYTGLNDIAGSGSSVNSIDINQGTLAFSSNAGNGGTAASTINMTGGTISGNGGGNTFNWFYGNTYTPILTSSASSVDSVISANLNIRLNSPTNSITFNVAQGTTPDGVDLRVSGNVTAASTGDNQGGIIKTGAGTMLLSGANTYDGSTTIDAGTLQIGGVPTAPYNAVAHYTFAGNLNDVTGNGHNGSAVGSPTYTTGRFGQAITFNGANQGMTAPYSATLPTSAYTVSFWENVSSYATSTFFSTRTGSSDGTFDIQLTAAGTLHGDIGSGGGNWITTTADAATTLPTNVWNMVTYTVNGSGYQIYVNGVPAANGSGTYSATPLFIGSTNTLTLGEQSSASWLNGSMDDVYVFGNALTAAQVNSLYLGQLWPIAFCHAGLARPGGHVGPQRH